jgi:hypothetical protein
MKNEKQARVVRKNLERLNRLNEEVLKRAYVKVCDVGNPNWDKYEEFEERFYDLLKIWNQNIATVELDPNTDWDPTDFTMDCQDLHIFCCEIENWFKTLISDEID